jgi:hypothetical protein
MSKSSFAVLTPLLAMVALVAPLTAQAKPSGPHWLTNDKVIRNEERVLVRDRGTERRIHFALSGRAAAFTCLVSLRDVITNSTSREIGMDEMVALGTKHCVQTTGSRLCLSGRLEVTPKGLPWPSHLSSEQPPDAFGINVIEGVGLDAHCGAAAHIGSFKGTLNAFVRQDPTRPNCGGLNPAPCAWFEYRGEPTLSSGAETLSLSGHQKVFASEGGTGANVQICFCDQRR